MSGLKQRAGQTSWVCSRRIRTQQNIHCGQATQACFASGDLRTPCWGKHFRQSAQRLPLYTAWIRPCRERKMWGRQDGNIPYLAVQKAAVRCYPTADSHGIRRERRTVKFWLSERNPTYKKWLTRVALGASDNAMGSLWLISVTPKVSAGKERKIEYMLSTCLNGCKKERKSPLKG